MIVPKLAGSTPADLADWAQRLIAQLEREGLPGDATTAGSSGVDSQALCPVGSMLPYMGSTAPDGWLLCLGQIYLDDELPQLRALIGTKYSLEGDPDGTWRLPNGKRATFMGTDTGFDPSGGGTVTLSADNLPSFAVEVTDGREWDFTPAPHTHTVSDPNHTHTLSGNVLVPAGTVTVAPGAVEIQLGSSATLTVGNAATGVTVNNASGGGTVAPTGDITAAFDGAGEALDVVPTYFSGNWIIKL